MIRSITEILKINKEEDMFRQFGEMEVDLTKSLQPLRDKLAMQVLTPDVPSLELHLTYVESWRDRVGHYLSLAVAFTEHAKCSYFILPSGRGVTEHDRRAYEKKMVAGFIALRTDLEELIYSIDSRVNNCKKLLGIEADVGGARSSRRYGT